MPRFIDLLLRLVGFGRTTPATPLGRLLRHANQLLTILGVLWIALHFFPQVLFRYHTTHHGVTVYARQPLPEETSARIDEALSLVRQSQLAVADRIEQVFLCNHRWLFALLAPTSFRSFAFQMPWTGNIFVADADLATDISRSAAATHNTRSASAVIAHEITHELIVHHLGLLRAVRLPSWVAEGYCDYVAQESSFPETEGLQLLARGEEDPSPSYKYFLYRRMVAHLLDTKGYSFDDIVAHAGEASAIRLETLATLRSLR